MLLLFFFNLLHAGKTLCQECFVIKLSDNLYCTWHSQLSLTNNWKFKSQKHKRPMNEWEKEEDVGSMEYYPRPNLKWSEEGRMDRKPVAYHGWTGKKFWKCNLWKMLQVEEKTLRIIRLVTKLFYWNFFKFCIASQIYLF